MFPGRKVFLEEIFQRTAVVDCSRIIYNYSLSVSRSTKTLETMPICSAFGFVKCNAIHKKRRPNKNTKRIGGITHKNESPCSLREHSWAIFTAASYPHLLFPVVCRTKRPSKFLVLVNGLGLYPKWSCDIYVCWSPRRAVNRPELPENRGVLSRAFRTPTRTHSSSNPRAQFAGCDWRRQNRRDSTIIRQFW